MITIELTNQPIMNPGLYIMRWRGRKGLVRIVGKPDPGFNIINPPNAPESYFQDAPHDIPPDALLSEPLVLVDSRSRR